MKKTLMVTVNASLLCACKYICCIENNNIDLRNILIVIGEDIYVKFVTLSIFAQTTSFKIYVLHNT